MEPIDVKRRPKATSHAQTVTVLELRIDEVLARKIFPDAKAWCVAAGVSEGYIATLKRRLRLGLAKSGKLPELRKLAVAASVPLGWLTGDEEPGAPTPVGDPPFEVFTESVRARPGLAATLALRGRRWRVRTVVRALEFNEPEGLDDARAVTWWTKRLDEIEQGDA